MEPPPFAGRHAPVRRAIASGSLFFAGILLPLVAVGVELFTNLCARSLFDPIPTWVHLALVAAVPAVNLRLWIARRREVPPSRPWLLVGCAAGGVALCYSLFFLPIYPFAAIGILFFGLGLLPFAPLGAAISTFVLVRAGAKGSARPVRALAVTGVLGAVFVLLALDVPTVITREAVRAASGNDAARAARAVELMRSFGDRDVLLRLCYDTSRQNAGLLGLLYESRFWMLDERAADGFVSPIAARELYYRVTGDPFNAVPPPFDDGSWRFAQAWQWDEDRGGTEVGSRLRGLALRSSRFDGSMDADDAVAYVEWTAEFSNAAFQPHEARATLALPPGAVVSRATLWVNGVEREAVFATREAARAAYESVVRTRRDPLLVTTNGADQVLIQMFPVPAQGSSKLRIGITAPLVLDDGGRATFAMPAIVDRNFSIDATLRHSVWIEGDARDVEADPGFTLDASGTTVRRRANYSDVELATRRPRLTLSRDPGADRAGSGKVVQTIRRESREPAGSMFVVVDGSKRAKPAREALLGALQAVPAGARVGFAIAGPETVVLGLAPWSAERRVELEAALERQPFAGGEDNLGALGEAIASLEREPAATLLWIHGPQPHEFASQAAGLEQALDRSSRLPDLWLLPVAAGPNKLLGHARLVQLARTRAWSGDPRADITAAFEDYFTSGPRWTVHRALSQEDVLKGSQHIEKLWARDEVESLVARGPQAAAEAARLSAQYRIVTPVSGAVVLETDVDYARAGLTPPDPSLVPTIPEPGEWALMIVACLAFGWMAWQRRRAAA